MQNMLELKKRHKEKESTFQKRIVQTNHDFMSRIKFQKTDAQVTTSIILMLVCLLT